MARTTGSGTYRHLEVDDYPPLNSPGLKSFARDRPIHFTRRQAILALAAVVSLIVLAFHTGGRAPTVAAALSRSKGSPPARRGVLYRTKSLTNEGVGSAPQHFKSSLLLAELLEREFVLEPLESEHGYSLSDIFNAGAAARDDLVFELPTCEIDEVGGWLWGDLLKACEDPEARVALRRKFEDKYAGCGTLFHNVQQYDWFQDGNGCAHDWFQRNVRQHVCSKHWTDADKQAEAAKARAAASWWGHALGAGPARGAPVRLGVHFRWGDTQPKPGEEVDRFRGIQIGEVNAAVARLERCGVPLAVSLYAEGLPDEVDAKFTFAHGIVDSGDSIQDVCRLGQEDVIIGGASGFGVFAYQVGQNYLQLITDVGLFKYKGTNTSDFTVLDVNALDDRVCDYLVRPTSARARA